MALEMEKPPVVLVFDKEGTEWVEFDLSRMKKEEHYPFAYQGELYTVKRCHRSVSIMEFANR